MKQTVTTFLFALVIMSCATTKPEPESAPAEEAIQTEWPTDALTLHLVRPLSMKNEPLVQSKANQYCNQLSEDFTQCAIFDGHEPNARLSGVEYIISERIYAQLPVTERRFWHPHRDEILEGRINAPGLAAERDTLRSYLTTYGKTFHFPFTASSDTGMEAIPMGEPQLGWSFDGIDHPVNASLLQELEREFEFSTAQKQAERQSWTNMEQAGQVGE